MKWRDIKRKIKGELTFYRLLVAHPKTPRLTKVFLGLALAYLVSPIDLIPDFIPILGQLDDVLVVPGLIWLALIVVPDSLQAQLRCAARSVTAETDVH